jgi:hypothetical protein
MPNRSSVLAVIAALMSASFLARADDPSMALQPKKGPAPIPVEKTKEQGVVSGGRIGEMTAHVKAIDLAKREVTLRGPEGRVETVVAGPEVKNLERLEVGDRVNIRFREGLVLRLQPPGAGDVAAEGSEKVERTGRGDVSAGVETTRARATVTVAAIDLASRVVTLQSAEGKTYVVKVGPDIALERVKVGDRFTATYSAALAVSVEPVHADKRSSGPLPGG